MFGTDTKKMDDKLYYIVSNLFCKYNNSWLMELKKITDLNISLKLLRIKKYLAIYSEAIESLAKQESIISLLPDTTEFAEKTNLIKELIKKHTSAIRFSETISAEKNKITSISKNIEGLTVPNRETVSEIDSSINKYVRIKNAFETIRKDTRRINAADTFIANSEIVNT